MLDDVGDSAYWRTNDRYAMGKSLNDRQRQVLIERWKNKDVRLRNYCLKLGI
jgi:hypothetical protein